MNDNKPSRLSVYYPLFLVVMLIAGVFIGSRFSGGDGSGDQFLPIPGKSRYNKIAQILNYIDQDYVDSVQKEKLVNSAISAILKDLDPHSYYIPASEMAEYNDPLEGNFDGIGVEFMILNDTVRVVSAIEGGPSEKLGIQAGDKIVSVEGKNIAGNGITNKNVVDMLRGKRGTDVNIKVMRGSSDKLIPFKITRGEIPIYSLATAQMLNDTTGYIKLSRFARTTYDEFMHGIDTLKHQGMKELVLDLRGNGGGYLSAAKEIAQEFLTKGQLIVYTKGKSQPKHVYRADKTGSLVDMPVAVLINEGTASAAEILTGALQDNDRGVIVGRRSFGKGLVQEQLPLGDRSALRLTVARYYTPTGRCIQKPYGDSIDYNDDYIHRYEHGELVDADSIHFNDSLKFTTPGGKTVYGGGGIMPDIFVPIDTVDASYYLSELSYSGAINAFAFDYANKHRQALMKYGNFKAFANDYKLPDSVFTELINYAASKGVPKDPKGISTSSKVIRNRLEASISRNLYGNNGFYSIVLKDDNVLDKAEEAL